ncbi:uncharacterized protein UV8b_00098 [Ustilaginoidea virens]|uniref:Acetylxylan esterase n=1 Tax=Ustilaginoidea virens TaxID=1159556 RepID=A0A8E5MDS7_USTVR|nr:uncharacterized protein UV8b_00098 [Ustilaginoidea virens]QUC15857.1 hypothetical protein UV8b_00098 [Ustilaginoidea virens]
MKHILLPVALLAARATVPAPEPGDSAQGCAKGLYLISARGTGEAAGIGAAGTIIGRQIKEQIKDSKVVALDYPASFSDPAYALSVANGTRSLADLITEHVKSCPDDKIALMGYSQGAQLTLDTLCGSDEKGFAKTEPISPADIDNHVVAVVLFGDPTHIANITYDRGTSTRNGIFPRSNSDSCLRYSKIIASWCDTGDVYCDSGNDTATHGQYLPRYGTEIAKFLVEKYQDSNTGASLNASASQPATAAATSSSSSPSGTAVGTSSPAATTTRAVSVANVLNIASSGLFVALPAALAAVFHMM